MMTKIGNRFACDQNGTTTAVTISLAALVAAGAAYGVWRLTSNLIKQPPKDADLGTEGSICTKLLEGEQQLLTRRGGSNPITTLTWFEGDIGKAAEVLKERVRDIIKANPWVAGSIIQQDGTWTICYEETIDDVRVSDFLKIANPSKDSDPSLGIGPKTLIDMVCQICVKHKLMLEDRNDVNQPLWRVAIFPDSNEPKKRFAITVALSHVAGDGHTYYRLFNMLVGGEKVHSLTARRIQSSMQQVVEIMGSDEARLSSNWGFVVCMLRGIFKTKLLGPLIGTKRYKGTSRCLLVDSKKIEQMKQDYQATRKEGMPPFISTNDILTSWFFRNCTFARHAVMAINFRGRLSSHTDAHAGNYENVLYYRLPQDADEPSLIRRSLSTFRRVVTADTPISARKFMFQDACLVSTWSTFVCHTTDLAGCIRLVHMPAYDIGKVLPCTLTSCIIFDARPNQLALLIAGTETNLQAFSNAPFELKEKLI